MHPRIFRYVVAGKILLKIAFQLEEPVTRATSGGKSGGGVAITAFRESLIKSYRELGHDIEMAAARRLPSIARVVVQNHKIKSEIAAPSVGTEILRNQQPPVISTPVVLTVGSAL